MMGTDHTFEVIKKLYIEGNSCHKIEKLTGISHSRIHRFLIKQGINRKVNLWTEADDKCLTKHYTNFKRGDGVVKKMIKLLRRTKGAIESRVEYLGLTVPNRRLNKKISKKYIGKYPRKWDGMSKEAALVWFNEFKQYPKGIKSFANYKCLNGNGSRGLRNIFIKFFPEEYNAVLKIKERLPHPYPLTEEHKRKIGISNTGKKLSQSTRRKLSESCAKRLIEKPEAFMRYPRSKSARRRPDLNDIFFRSSWEANYARYLNFIKVKWEFEAKTFWFENIRRGCRSYLPDFWLPEINEYHEVKGWMDSKSKTKLKRMKKYYPEVKLVIIDRRFFADIKRKGLDKIIKGWE